MLTRPGLRSSEFAVAAVNVLVQALLALTDYISSGTATKLSVAGAVAFIVSRGLAKYEPRQTTVQSAAPPAPAAPAPPPQSV